MAADLVSGDSLTGFVKAHPYATAGIGVGVVVVVWLLVANSGGSSTTAASGSTDDTATEAAAALSENQQNLNAQVDQAQIQAGVTNNQTAAAQAVALAQTQGATQTAVAASAATAASAYYGAATEISANNSAVAIAQTQAQTTQQADQDNLLASEFSSLAGVISNFGSQTASITTSGINSQTALGESDNTMIEDANKTAATTSSSTTSGTTSGTTSATSTPGAQTIAVSGASGGAYSNLATQTGLSNLAGIFSQGLNGLLSAFTLSANSSTPNVQQTASASLNAGAASLASNAPVQLATTIGNITSGTPGIVD